MMASPRSWTYQGQDGTTYTCSTDPSLLDLRALNAALGSDMLWWASTLPDDKLQTMVDHCLMLAVYQVDPATQKRTMIGASKVITDHVTFAYLTDVYVLKEHQQRGLGTFMMKCLNEILDEWPELRGMWIMSSSAESRKVYEKIFGATEFFQARKGHNLTLLEKRGPQAAS